MTKNEWILANKAKIDLSKDPIIMGILNVTPDSFSDGGVNIELETALKNASLMYQAGATVIDIGGESTRPDCVPIDGDEERKRIMPVIEHLAQSKHCMISVDTYRAETARQALERGAHIINDIWGLQKEPTIAEYVAAAGAGIIIMHNSRDRSVKDDMIEDLKYFFDQSITIALKAGIQEKQIVLDPGFGFGKNIEQNIELLRRASELKAFNFPLLAATSRKRFLGYLINNDIANQRDTATAATSVILRQAGFSIFRVHNIACTKDALSIVDSIL